MREDLLGPKVENVAMVVAQELLEGEVIYNVYLISLRDDIMEGVIITSKGYGENPDTGEKKIEEYLNRIEQTDLRIANLLRGMLKFDH